MTPFSQNRTKVFISYSHNDIAYTKRIRVHFAYYERVGMVDVWDDTSMSPGDVWHKEIEKAISQTKVAVLLISADFLASRFIAENELPPLLAAARREGAAIIPVILSPCGFEDTELSQFQAINSPSKPMSSMSKNEKEQTWLLVSREVTKLMNSQRTKPHGPSSSQIDV